MGAYLPWLLGRLEDLGVCVTRRWLPALPAPTDGSVVVNCTGLGAGGLAHDSSVYPVRGQIVRLQPPRGAATSGWWTIPARPTGRSTSFRAGREVVVGGTADSGSYDLRPDAGTARDLDRARRRPRAGAGGGHASSGTGWACARPAPRTAGAVAVRDRRRVGGALLRPRGRGGDVVLGLRRRGRRARRGGRGPGGTPGRGRVIMVPDVIPEDVSRSPRGRWVGVVMAQQVAGRGLCALGGRAGAGGAPVPQRARAGRHRRHDLGRAGAVPDGRRRARAPATPCPISAASWRPTSGSTRWTPTAGAGSCSCPWTPAGLRWCSAPARPTACPISGLGCTCTGGRRC